MGKIFVVLNTYVMEFYAYGYNLNDKGKLIPHWPTQYSKSVHEHFKNAFHVNPAP
jgi:hypothetical protein